jgi:hypothetical protein
MKARKRGTFEPATLGNIRSHGCRNLLIYCGSIHCNYQTKMNADHLPDETPSGRWAPAWPARGAVTAAPTWGLTGRHTRIAG